VKFRCPRTASCWPAHPAPRRPEAPLHDTPPAARGETAAVANSPSPLAKPIPWTFLALIPSSLGYKKPRSGFFPGTSPPRTFFIPVELCSAVGSLLQSCSAPPNHPRSFTLLQRSSPTPSHRHPLTGAPSPPCASTVELYSPPTRPLPALLFSPQAHLQVRLGPLNLSRPLDLAAGNHRRQNRPVNSSPPLDHGQGPHCFD
jgi:hypothetical protein